jgi:hypothetical protein
LARAGPATRSEGRQTSKLDFSLDKISGL